MVKRLRTTTALAVVVIMLVARAGAARDRRNAAASAASAAAPSEEAPSEAAPSDAAPSAERFGRAGGAATCPRSRPATPSWTRPSAQTSRTTARRSRSRPVDGGEGEGFAAAIEDFQKATGIAVQVDSIGSSHETVLKTRIEGGSPPDMAALAQPTGRARVRRGRQGQRHRHDRGPQAKLKAEFPSTIGLTSEGDHIWSIPTKADVKSMIWYPSRPSRPRATRFPRPGTSSSPWPTRSSPTAATRSASAPAAPARRPAGS